ncbi:hypothetical protein HY468_04265 [Candidatus Roizmanbacteria bacterium]|nr:hypothetical protein [Candidatus Roizmanbacteria bacterium]
MGTHPESSGTGPPSTDLFNPHPESIRDMPAYRRFKEYSAAYPIHDLDWVNGQLGRLSGALFQYMVDDLLQVEFPGSLILDEESVLEQLIQIQQRQPRYGYRIHAVDQHSFMVQVAGKKRPVKFATPDDLIFTRDVSGNFQLDRIVETKLTLAKVKKPPPPDRMGQRLPANTYRLALFLRTKEGEDMMKRIVSSQVNHRVNLVPFDIFDIRDVYLKVTPIREGQRPGWKTPHKLSAPWTHSQVIRFAEEAIFETVYGERK